MFCHSKHSQQGFTLVEMMVVVAIFIITTGIVLSNFSGFRQKSSLDLLAREMALVIRQAQVYGTATKKYGGTSEKKFPSYGVYFNPATPDNFILFADQSGSDGKSNGKYDSANSELVEQFNLTGGAKIRFPLAGCTSSSSCSPISDSLHIIFTRPAPGAAYTVGNSAQNYAFAKITIVDEKIADPAQQTREIHVWNTGHIYVKSHEKES